MQASPGVRPREALRRFWRGGLDFGGESARAEFWWPLLLNAVLAVVVFAAASVVFTLTLGTMVGAARGFGGTTWSVANASATGIAALALLAWGLAVLLPSAAVLVRRLHDAGLSGLLALLWFLPVVGVLVVCALALLPPAAAERFDED